MPDPVSIATIASAVLQAGGMAASIFGQDKQQEELERQARERAKQTAWTNLISVAGGGGPVAVPNPTTGMATNDLSQIGQIASGLGSIVGQTAGALDQHGTNQLQKATSLAAMGVNPGKISGVPDDTMQGLTEYAKNMNALNLLKKQELTAKAKGEGQPSFTALNNLKFKFAEEGVPVKGNDIDTAFDTLTTLSQTNKEQTQANSGFYAGDKPGLIKVSNTAVWANQQEQLKPIWKFVESGTLTPEMLPPGLPAASKKRLLEASEINFAENKASLDKMKRDVDIALSKEGIANWEKPELLSALTKLDNFIEGSKPSDIVVMLAKKDPEFEGMTTAQVVEALSKNPTASQKIIDMAKETRDWVVEQLNKSTGVESPSDFLPEDVLNTGLK